jgi:ATP-dependent RNA helicase DHX8/PRP22
MDRLKATAGAVKKSFSLKSSDYPRGMMKALVVAYGPDLEKLKQDCGATILDLVIHQHAVCFQGSSEACDTLERLLGELANGLPQQQRNEATEDSLPECPVCFVEVAKDSFHVMEYCGHVYCKECAASLVENAIRNNDIPIRCAAENCAELVLQDVRNIHGRNLQSVHETALRTFVQRRGDEYKNCITPNCRMIYRRTPPNEEGKKFDCTECQTSLCTSCNVLYHHGFSCNAFRLMKTFRRRYEAMA